jgi:protein TonB
MTALVPTSRHLAQSAAGRIWPALAASAFIHLLLATAPVAGVSPRNAQPEGIALITARIEPLPRSKLVHATTADKEEFSMPHAVKRDVAVSDGAGRKTAPRAASGMERSAALPSALPQVPDPTVYTARDLDSYPRPVVPLEFDRFAARAMGLPPAEVRLELLIDEQGIVDNVAFAEPGLSSQMEMQMRAAVTATRFVPARRNGRAVRSRVLLSVNFETKNVND